MNDVGESPGYPTFIRGIRRRFEMLGDRNRSSEDPPPSNRIRPGEAAASPYRTESKMPVAPTRKLNVWKGRAICSECEHWPGKDANLDSGCKSTFIERRDFVSGEDIVIRRAPKVSNRHGGCAGFKPVNHRPAGAFWKFRQWWVRYFSGD